MAKNSAATAKKPAGQPTKSAASAKLVKPEVAEDAKAKSKDAKAKGAKDGQKKAKKKQSKPGELTSAQKVVIVLFIVVFAFSTLASALSSVFSSSTSSTSTTETTSEESTDSTSEDADTSDDDADSDSTDDADTTDDSDADSEDDLSDEIVAIDEKYTSTLASFEDKVAADSTDTASVLALARYTSQWASAVEDEASTDAETSHANELYEQAIAYYDQYLELEDSNAARVDQAMCKYYEGDTSAAVSALEELVESDPDCALAWANLGILYEIQSSTDSAKNAYQYAVAKDPDDEYGAKSYAQSRLASIAEDEESSSSSSSTSSSSTSSTSLTDTLSSLSGVSL